MPLTRVQDLDVHYEIAGRAGDGAETVLLVHGLGSSTEDWAPQVEALSAQFRVVTYDVRGHGQTSKPAGSYSVPQFAGDAASLIEALGLGAVHLVGLSMGGMIGFQLAADRPDLVRSLVIVNSGPEMILRTRKERLAIAQRRWIIRLMGMRAWGKVLADRLLPSEEAAGERHGGTRWRFTRRAAVIWIWRIGVGRVKVREPQRLLRRIEIRDRHIWRGGRVNGNEADPVTRTQAGE